MFCIKIFCFLDFCNKSPWDREISGSETLFVGHILKFFFGEDWISQLLCVEFIFKILPEKTHMTFLNKNLKTLLVTLDKWIRTRYWRLLIESSEKAIVSCSRMIQDSSPILPCFLWKMKWICSLSKTWLKKKDFVSSWIFYSTIQKRNSYNFFKCR